MSVSRTLVVAIAALLATPLLAQEQDRPFWANKPGPKAITPKGMDPAPAPEPTGIREVTAGPRTVVKVNTRVRFTTLILLPDDEEIMDDTCGDRDLWEAHRSDKNHNIYVVKPADKNLVTNVNLTSTSGTTYSFLLSEGKAPTPDLKVYVTTDVARATGRRKYYNAEQYDALQGELIATKAALEAAEKRAAEPPPAATSTSDAVRTPQHTYGPVRDEKPFHVKGIWQDGQFTYIQIGKEAREVPAVYELVDGKPGLVNAEVEHGTIVVKKVIDRGYLAIGNARLHFTNTGN